MTAALRAERPADLIWCGMHLCVCGALSECQDYMLPSGMRTNSLLVHGEAEPTEMKLLGRREGH